MLIIVDVVRVGIELGLSASRRCRLMAHWGFDRSRRLLVSERRVNWNVWHRLDRLLLSEGMWWRLLQLRAIKIKQLKSQTNYAIYISGLNLLDLGLRVVVVVVGGTIFAPFIPIFPALFGCEML